MYVCDGQTVMKPPASNRYLAALPKAWEAVWGISKRLSVFDASLNPGA